MRLLEIETRRHQPGARQMRMKTVEDFDVTFLIRPVFAPLFEDIGREFAARHRDDRSRLAFEPEFPPVLEDRLAGQEFRRVVVLGDDEAREGILVEIGNPLAFLPFAPGNKPFDGAAHHLGGAKAERQLPIEDEKCAPRRRRERADLSQHIRPEIGNESRFINAIDETGLRVRI